MTADRAGAGAQPAHSARLETPGRGDLLLTPLMEAAPRIAVYGDRQAPPEVFPLPTIDGVLLFGTLPETSEEARPDDGDDNKAAGRGHGAVPVEAYARTPSYEASSAEETVPRLIEVLTARAYALARGQGGCIPIGVFRELIENLVHADFAGVVVTICDRGNTIRVTDQGPGIPDKDAAQRAGFTSADARARRYIRGVGSGFSVVKETLAALGGSLEIEDNLGKGTVVTARVPPPAETPLAPIPTPEYNLPERQLKVLLLTVELAPVGPTRIAQELGVSTSTVYRDLVSLEHAGFVACRPTGHRSATEAGLAYLDAVL